MEHMARAHLAFIDASLDATTCGRPAVFDRMTMVMLQNLANVGQRGSLCNRWPCGGGCQHMYIHWDGNLYPCDRFQVYPEMNMGCISESSMLTQTAQSSRVHYILQARHSDKVTECRNCALRVFCGGDCAADTYAVNGTFTAVSPQCNYWKVFITGLMERMILNPLDVVEEGRSRISNL